MPDTWQLRKRTSQERSEKGFGEDDRTVQKYTILTNKLDE